MKIDSITMHHLRMQLRAPFETTFGSIDARDCIILELHAGDFVAYGECAVDRDPLYSYENVGTAWHILQDYIIPAVLNSEVKDATDFQSRVAFVRGHNMAKAGLEMALWDLWGKRDERSLADMLGGQRDKVAVGVSIGIKSDPQTLVAVAQDYVALGYQRVKLKIKPGRDVAEVQLVRETFPDLKLQVDANSAYTLDNMMTLKPLDELDLLLIEQPLAEDDLWDHAKMQAKFRTPICLDESILSPRHARHALEMGATRVINIKPGRVGGLSQAVAIHDLCQAQDVPVWCGGMLETNVGRASNIAVASLPNFALPGDISASDRYYHEDITLQQFTLNADSSIDVPTAPGLGVDIDAGALARATLKSLTLPAK